MKLFTFATLLLIGASPVIAQTTPADALARLKGQPLYLRGHWAENKLSFDADGKPLGTYTQVPFSEAGFDCRSAEIKDAALVFKGKRAGVKFVNNQPVRVNNGPDMTINVALPSSGDASNALDLIFAPDLISLVPSMDEYWQPWAQAYLLPHEQPVKNPPFVIVNDRQQAPLLNHIVKGIKPPRVTHSVDPAFTQMARDEKISGSVEIYLWLEKDGLPTHLRIVRPLGLGLDERALDAVSHYKFKPATQNGEPVKVDLYIDVNFQIF